MCARGDGDLGRLRLLLFHGIVPTVCNPVVIGAVRCGSIPPLPPSPASVGSGCCISLLFIRWCLNLGFIGEKKAEQSGFSAPGIYPEKGGLVPFPQQQIQTTPLAINQVYFYQRRSPCSE